MRACWNRNPKDRPVFDDLIARLRRLLPPPATTSKSSRSHSSPVDNQPDRTLPKQLDSEQTTLKSGASVRDSENPYTPDPTTGHRTRRNLPQPPSEHPYTPDPTIGHRAKLRNQAQPPPDSDYEKLTRVK